jgi:uncharacterized membrane protein
MTKTWNYRFAGYLLIAIGLLNWRYQTSDSNIALKSLIIIVLGAFTLALTFSTKGLNFLNSKAGTYLGFVIGVLAILFAIFN